MVLRWSGGGLRWHGGGSRHLLVYEVPMIGSSQSLARVKSVLEARVAAYDWRIKESAAGNDEARDPKQ
ncbi:hypothetical protein Tco_0839142 [Tanacetum coccineum]|uniref:Uncharacterized protein n=1 Tax=Tanacetum coccineum TaxID=301880 RepID=A0ABQ5AQG8_9ASTR